MTQSPIAATAKLREDELPASRFSVVDCRFISSETANKDCRHPTSLEKKMSFTCPREKGLLWLAQRKRHIRLALEPVRAECFLDFADGTVLRLNLNRGVTLPKTDSPPSRVSFRMQITDEDISVESRDPSQFVCHVIQV
jgi:hypothetical protein